MPNRNTTALVCAGLAASLLIASVAQGQDVSFIAPLHFDAGRNPVSMAMADFNGDGIQDLAVANDTTNFISVLLGNGDGTFQAPRSIGVGTNPRSVAVGDFNGDGVQDLAVANVDSQNVSVLLGNGDGSFQAARNFATGNGPFSVAVG